MKKLTSIIVFVLAIFLLLPSVSFASFVATENFDSYSNGQDLNGASGGTGWTGNWTTYSGGTTAIATSSQFDTGPNSGEITVSDLYRSFTTVTSGTHFVRFRKIGDGPWIRWYNGTTVTIYLRVNGGNLEYYDGYSYASLGSVSDSTWYTAGIEIDQANHPNQVNYLKPDGTWTGYVASPTGGDPSPNRFYWGANSGVDFEIDSISPIAPPSISGSGTNNRLAKFKTSTTITDSLLSDDGLDVTLTSGNLFLPLGSIIDTITSGTLNIGTLYASLINIGNADSTINFNGPMFLNSIGTTSNCNSSASPAVCGSAPAGSVALPNGGDTLVVDTTKITADSQVFITEDSSLGSRLSVTCNTNTGRTYSISARTPGTSFTIKSSADPGSDNACLSYFIIN